ncbi:MarR family transcriptional regulator [Mucilaginibacter sp. PAMB04274]|uniref:MarR family winged helix-turn-helix transcriptional regulator n=1 Tax=Mucilaginibacter sp. PAMB04274 TaxID=3138568 RepID=UPI0031F6F12F
MEQTEDEGYHKLDHQLCFPLYAASRLVTKCYQPVLDELGLTYPQYLVLMVLWESDAVNLSRLSERLKLQSNTLTPLLKRMEELGLLTRQRSKQDERSIIIALTEKGKSLKSEVPRLQQQLMDIGISKEEAIQLKGLLTKMINYISG